jgi:hypothetical protein
VLHDYLQHDRSKNKEMHMSASVTQKPLVDFAVWLDALLENKLLPAAPCDSDALDLDDPVSIAWIEALAEGPDTGEAQADFTQRWFVQYLRLRGGSLSADAADLALPTSH